MKKKAVKKTRKRINAVDAIVKNMETKVDNALLSNQILEIKPILTDYSASSVNAIYEVAEQATRFAENLRKLSLLSNRLSVTLQNSNETLENILGK